MTTRTHYPVTCDCGHVGAIRMSEDDQPYSKKWESYHLEDLNGEASYSLDGFATWDQVFEQMRPTCPNCGAALSPSQLDSK